jgi:hypothetical protein
MQIRFSHRYKPSPARSEPEDRVQIRDVEEVFSFVETWSDEYKTHERTDGQTEGLFTKESRR